MSKLSPAEKKLATWLGKHLAKFAPEITLAYLEWNQGWKNAADYRLQKPKSMIFSLFGYSLADANRFDPENTDHVAVLSAPTVQVREHCLFPLGEIDDDQWYEMVENSVRSSTKISVWLANRALAFGLHESEVEVIAGHREIEQTAEAIEELLYYEFHQAAGANSIESYEIGTFDETPLLKHDRVNYWPEQGIKLVLQDRVRLKDVLYFYRGWLVCTEKVMRLFQDVTDQIQVFSASLFTSANSGSQPVDGYFVVNLYEKLDCIAAEFVTPPRWKNGPEMFDPRRGYKVKRSTVPGKSVFRLNYEHYRLVVSQQLRDQFDREGITGVKWLRRESVP